MKRTLILATLLATALGTNALADTITTARGKTYRDCRIKKVEPDGISFTHQDGAAKILFTDLPSAMRAKYGYDRKKADAYAKKVAEQRKEAEKRRQDYLRREAEAIEAAQFINAMRTVQAQNNLILAQTQGYSTGYGPIAGFYNGNAGWYGGGGPITGPVLNGRPYRPTGGSSVGIATIVPGTGGIYAPTSGGFAYYPPVYPALGYARPGYRVTGSWNVGGGVRVGVGVGAVPPIGPAPFVPAPAVVPRFGGSGGSVVIPVR